MSEQRETPAGVEGKVVAITGVTTGIGRAVAQTFAHRGAAVVGTGRRLERGAEIAAALTGQGHRFDFIQGDMSRQGDCEQFVADVMRLHGRIDVLVNNVGGNGELGYASVPDISGEAFDEVIDLNLRSAVFCCRYAWPHMAARNEGLILNVSSVVSLGGTAMAHQSLYNAAKAAMNQFTRTLAVEGEPHGIRANAVIIGGAATKQAMKSMRVAQEMLGGSGVDAARMPAVMSGTPMDDIARAFVALASDDCRAITGALVPVDRAMSAGSVYSTAMLNVLRGAWTEPN